MRSGFVFALALLTLATAAAVAEEITPAPVSSEDDGGVGPLVTFPTLQGASVIQYGPNDWRLIVWPFEIRGRDNADSSPNAITLFALEIQHVDTSSRWRVFEYGTVTGDGIEDPTVFQWSHTDYTDFRGFYLPSVGTYRVYVISRDFDDSLAFENLIAVLDVDSLTPGAAALSGESLH